MRNKFICKSDIIIILVTLAVTGGILLFRYFSSSYHLTAVISVDGKVIEQIDLSSLDEVLTITPDTDIHTVIKAEKNAIYFESSECRDRICVSAGKLTKKGDTAVCLPSRTVISITGDDIDAITR